MTCKLPLTFLTIVLPAFFQSCANYGESGHGSMVSESTSGQLLAEHPTVEQRQSDLAQEPLGDYFIGRRYFVRKTTFWGYLRKPRQPWNKARLVSMNEWQTKTPDRLPEEGPIGQRFGYDQNYQYRVWGSFTGEKVYDPNSNKFIPEFKLRKYELIDTDPGWLFSPKDRYNEHSITLMLPQRD